MSSGRVGQIAPPREATSGPVRRASICWTHSSARLNCHMSRVVMLRLHCAAKYFACRFSPIASPAARR